MADGLISPVNGVAVSSPGTFGNLTVDDVKIVLGNNKWIIVAAAVALLWYLGKRK